MKNINLIKLLLAVLLIACLADLPYGYYQFVRFAGLVGFGYLAFNANEQGKKNEVFIYLALAVLFQPFFKIALGRSLWNVIDVVVGIGLIVSLFKSDNKK
jgi:hypothetical protein